MLCQNCNQNEATMYWKQTINGQTKEMHLCPACAQKLGQNFQNPFGAWFDDPFFTQPSLFAAPFGQISQLGGGRRCPTCGMTESELQRTGRVGCADCYQTFENILMPYIRKLQGTTAHVGSAPNTQSHTQPVENQTEALKSKLDAAIRQENYEEAARLRDEIRRLEGQDHA